MTGDLVARTPKRECAVRGYGIYILDFFYSLSQYYRIKGRGPYTLGAARQEEKRCVRLGNRA